MKRIEKGRIAKTERIAGNLLCMDIEVPLIAKESLPGNFVTILPPAESQKFIRRPFSIAGTGKRFITLVIKGIGPVTGALLSLKEGDELDVMGPLGNCYEINYKPVWMIGGGTGIASLLFLNSVRQSAGNISGSFSQTGDRVLWAGRSAAQIPSEEMLGESGFSSIFLPNITLATDDGTAGEKGTAAEVLEQWLEKAKAGRQETGIALQAGLAVPAEEGPAGQGLGRTFPGGRHGIHDSAFGQAGPSRQGAPGDSDRAASHSEPGNPNLPASHGVTGDSGSPACHGGAVNPGNYSTRGTTRDPGNYSIPGLSSGILPGAPLLRLPAAIVSCGPHAMMKAVKDIADREGIPCWFSLEEFMACGAGACAGCAVPAAGGGYLKACDDGPVFPGGRIIL